MSMSLDRYIGAPNDEPDNSGVDGFIRLHDSGPHADGDLRTDGLAGQGPVEINPTGAVVGWAPRRGDGLIAYLAPHELARDTILRSELGDTQAERRLGQPTLAQRLLATT